MKDNPIISLITVNYNGLADTCALIDSVPFSERIEMIVVDNASRDDEAAVIAKRYPHVKTIRSEQNLGFAGGNNLGIKAAKGKYLFFINNDTLLSTSGKPAEEYFDPLISRMEASERTGMVCPKIRFAWGDNPIQFTGYTKMSRYTLRNRAIGFGESDEGQYSTPHPTPYAHGAAMMVSREAIDSAGLMPECYFLYYEELDWSLMIRRAGYDIWYEPSTTIYHKESKSTGQDSPLRAYYITRNRLLFSKRNIPAPNRYVTQAYLVCIVATRDIIKHTLHGRLDLVKATARGISAFYRNK